MYTRIPEHICDLITLTEKENEDYMSVRSFAGDYSIFLSISFGLLQNIRLPLTTKAEPLTYFSIDLAWFCI